MSAKLQAAKTLFSEGREHEAVDMLIGHLEDGPNANLPTYKSLLRQLLAQKRYTEGARWTEAALQRFGNDYDLLNIAGICYRRIGRYGEAVKQLDKAIKLQPRNSTAYVNKGNVCTDMRDGANAAAIFTKLIRQEPRNAEYHHSLGRALRVQEKHDAATSRFRLATTLQPKNHDAWLDYASGLTAMGKTEEAFAALDQAIALVPTAERLYQAKAVMLRRTEDFDRILAYLNSLESRFREAGWFHYETGRLYADFDRATANIAFRKAVSLEPANREYRLALAESLDRTRDSGEAANVEEAYRIVKDTDLSGKLLPSESKIALEILTRAGDYDATKNLGTFSELGREWAAYGRVTALMSLMARVETAEDRVELLQDHRTWGDNVIRYAKTTPVIRKMRARSTSKIRIGLMSSDLRSHPVTYFCWPLFKFRDSSRFELYCYSYYKTKQPGELQLRLASMVDGFRWNPFIGDKEAAQVIADDELNILFELGGSTHMNKINVMAWKPAPLCASWLGYPHSAGLSTIDYLLVDPFLNPPDSKLLIEKPLVMPQSWIVMNEQAFPDIHFINPVAPVRRNGFVTFGTANNPYKYNGRLIDSWAQVMTQVPGSRFLFVRPEAGVPGFVTNILSRFAANGIGADRVEFRAVRGRHMQHYNDIDISLDTFPQTGGTTTCESLWMGVPTVSLYGPAVFERLSYSILQNARLGDLCAPTVNDYVDVAVRLAANPDRIQDLRTGLREQLRASPLGQVEQFSHDFYDLIAKTVR